MKLLDAQKSLKWMVLIFCYAQAGHFTIFVLNFPLCAYVWKCQKEVYFSPPSKMKWILMPINQDQSLFLHYAYFDNANIVKQLGLTCNLLCLTKVFQVIELSHFRSSGPMIEVEFHVTWRWHIENQPPFEDLKKTSILIVVYKNSSKNSFIAISLQILLASPTKILHFKSGIIEWAWVMGATALF